MRHLLLFLLTLATLPFLSAQDVMPAPPDKAVVYFVRPGIMALAITFSIYEGDQLIGRLGPNQFFRYECDPGRHLFWGRSENRSFVEAELEAGKSYLIETAVTMGAFKAAVALVPTDPNGRRGIPKRIRKCFSKREPQLFGPEQLEIWREQDGERAARGMERYAKLKEKDRRSAQLTPEMAVEVTELYWEKRH